MGDFRDLERRTLTRLITIDLNDIGDFRTIHGERVAREWLVYFRSLWGDPAAADRLGELLALEPPERSSVAGR